MNKVLLFTSISFLFSCGSQDLKSKTFMEEEFNVYYQEFLLKAEQNNVLVPKHELHTKIVDQPDTEKPSIVGLCQSYITKVNNETLIVANIFVKREFWARMNYFGKELLMFHELGHCLLHKQHVDSSIQIMNTYFPNYLYYEKNRDSMITYLFNNDN